MSSCSACRATDPNWQKLRTGWLSDWAFIFILWHHEGAALGLQCHAFTNQFKIESWTWNLQSERTLVTPGNTRSFIANAHVMNFLFAVIGLHFVMWWDTIWGLKLRHLPVNWHLALVWWFVLCKNSFSARSGPRQWILCVCIWKSVEMMYIFSDFHRWNPAKHPYVGRVHCLLRLICPSKTFLTFLSEFALCPVALCPDPRQHLMFKGMQKLEQLRPKDFRYKLAPQEVLNREIN